MSVIMSANQHANAFFAKAIEMANASADKKVNLNDVFDAMPKPAQQTFHKNGITISFPMGWKNIHSYRSYIADSLKSSRLDSSLRQRRVAILANIDAALS